MYKVCIEYVVSSFILSCRLACITAKVSVVLGARLWCANTNIVLIQNLDERCYHRPGGSCGIIFELNIIEKTRVCIVAKGIDVALLLQLNYNRFHNRAATILLNLKLTNQNDRDIIVESTSTCSRIRKIYQFLERDEITESLLFYKTSW